MNKAIIEQVRLLKRLSGLSGFFGLPGLFGLFGSELKDQSNHRTVHPQIT
jgi:hypothetical protein